MTKQTLYLELTNKKIAPYAIVSGDPRRVEKILPLLDEYKEVSINREFHTYTGLYKQVPVTISSTGIGGPSAAIAIEELYEAGIKAVIRLGTVMGIGEDKLGKYFVPIAAMRHESTSKYYVDSSYPAVASIDLVNIMSDSVKEHDRQVENGVICSTDGYYTQMKESRLSREMNVDVVSYIENLPKYKISGLDMETATLLTIGKLMDIDVCSVTLATVTDNLKQTLESEIRKNEEMLLAKIVLEGIVKYHNLNNK
ncbi:nucleoside phosphorylase [Tuanshanicoccus lijuaniae]|uniref:nucleoside phosphorylase n=1 Tax=Aerococcaceae bacterium zg-1292 TaxID=2774330 RepID=UPI001938768E|nr:nucleoside phosphorylase [Aerococcaceae bacterium zg-1292]QQA36609.1 nucleoside phosphorylase [Aerococcaceae bacterium zg-1292]